jgi:hypothetical protein
MFEGHDALRRAVLARRRRALFPKQRRGLFQALARQGFGVETLAVNRINHVWRRGQRHGVSEANPFLAATVIFPQHIRFTVNRKAVLKRCW